MKITLIYPAIGQYLDEACMEPLSLGALAGFTPPDVEVALYDDRLEKIPYDEPTDLVAITVQIYAARRLKGREGAPEPPEVCPYSGPRFFTPTVISTIDPTCPLTVAPIATMS